jgi:hypothetical protein
MASCLCPPDNMTAVFAMCMVLFVVVVVVQWALRPTVCAVSSLFAKRARRCDCGLLPVVECTPASSRLLCCRLQRASLVV